jgi:hypothetical protein
VPITADGFLAAVDGLLREAANHVADADCRHVPVLM